MKFKNKVKCISLFLALLFIFQSFPASAIDISSDISIFDGILSVFPFSTIDVGRAGELKVNQQNQEIVIDRNDISLPGCDFPVDIKFYYSSLSDSKNKWHFNYLICLDKVDDTIVLTKKDGSKSTYVPTGEIIDDKEKWIIPEEFGILDYLLVPQGEYNFSDVILVTKLDGIFYFSDSGRLSSIKSDDGSYVFIYYNDNNQIQKVVDSIGRQYKISYDQNNNIDEIAVFDSNNKIITFENDNANTPYIFKYNYDRNNLTSIVYPDGNKVEYTYKKNKLVSIKNVDGRTYEIEYDGASAKSVKQLSGNNQKTLFEIKNTKDGVLLTDEYSVDVKKDFNGITPEIIKKAGDNYIEKLRIKNYASKTINSNLINSDSIESLQNRDNLNLEFYDFSDDYAYNNNTGIIEYSYDDCGNKTEQIYDCANNLVEMSADVSYLSEKIRTQYIYEADVLKSITRNNQKYSFLYDEWGNSAGVEIQEKPYVKYTYKDGKSELCEQITYGNGQIVNYYYDDENRLTGVSLDNGKSMIYEYYYDNSNLKIIDNSAGIVQNYYQDSIEITDIDTDITIMRCFYDDEDNLVMNLENETIKLSMDSYETDTSNYRTKINMLVNDLSSDISIVEDCFERINNMTVKYSDGSNMSTNIDYMQYNDTYETFLPAEYNTEYSKNDIKYGSDWSYDYYDNGKIKNIYLNNSLYAHYEYDNIGQLTRVDDYILSVTTTYNYDSGGNVVSKNNYDLMQLDKSNKQTVLSYDNTLWNDQLSCFDGNPIAYDEIGNPISYKNKTYKWKNGRQLDEYQDDQYKITYSYNEMGYRQTKSVYNKETGKIMYKYNYYWGNGCIIAYTLTDFTKLNPCTDTIVYQYDDNTNIHSYIVNGEDIYVYEKNASGDIIGIYNDVEYVGKYHYDESGNIHTIYSTEVASKYNQLYYRGYIYDMETELYYLQSRYYSPEWGRFLNADIYVDTGTGLLGTNMYIYCENDPINKIDSTGFWSKTIHKQITMELLSNASLGNHLDVDKIADGNAKTDDKYSAVKYFLRPEYQGRHFDRHIRVSEANGEDTRGYYANIHMDNAINAYKNNNYDTLNEEFGFALHCMQDFSSHGFIDVDRYGYASHAFELHVDDTNYDWTDENDRGRKNKSECVTKITNGMYGKRYKEAQEITGMILIIFLIRLEQI